MSLFNPQQMMINFLKGLGINEELIIGKMNEFAATVESYRREISSVNRRLDVMEQNIALICRKLDVSTVSTEEIRIEPVDKLKIVNKSDAA